MRPALYIFATILLVVGLLFTATALNSLYLGNVSKSWPTTKATIISNSVTQAQAPRASKNFKLNLLYTYTVNGKTYEDSKVSYPDEMSPRRTQMETLATQFPVGTIHDVHYLPKNPQVACLRPGANASYVTIFLALGAFWGYCSYRVFKYLKQSTSAPVN